MKVLGIILMIVGCIWGVVAFNMDTTVDTSRVVLDGYYKVIPGPTVQNIGKMDDRRNHLMVAGLFVIVGAILFAVGALKQKEAHPSMGREPEQDQAALSVAPTFTQTLYKLPSERSLESDEYQLYLVQTYNIEKNNTLEKYVVKGKVFPTLVEAVAFAHRLELRGQLREDDVETWMSSEGEYLLPAAIEVIKKIRALGHRVTITRSREIAIEVQKGKPTFCASNADILKAGETLLPKEGG